MDAGCISVSHASRPAAGQQAEQRRGDQCPGRVPSAFRPVVGSRGLIPYVQRPGPLPRNVDRGSSREQAAPCPQPCGVSLPKRNDIASSYSSTGGMPGQRCRAVASASTGAQPSAARGPREAGSNRGPREDGAARGPREDGSARGSRKAGSIRDPREERSSRGPRGDGPQDPCWAPQASLHTGNEQLADTLLKQEESRKGPELTTEGAVPGRRKALLLRPRRGKPLMLPPPPQLSYQVTGEHVAREKEAAFHLINSVLMGKRHAAEVSNTAQPACPPCLPAPGAAVPPATPAGPSRERQWQAPEGNTTTEPVLCPSLNIPGTSALPTTPIDKGKDRKSKVPRESDTVQPPWPVPGVVPPPTTRTQKGKHRKSKPPKESGTTEPPLPVPGLVPPTTTPTKKGKARKSKAPKGSDSLQPALPVPGVVPPLTAATEDKDRKSEDPKDSDTKQSPLPVSGPVPPCTAPTQKGKDRKAKDPKENDTTQPPLLIPGSVLPPTTPTGKGKRKKHRHSQISCAAQPSGPGTSSVHSWPGRKHTASAPLPSSQVVSGPTSHSVAAGTHSTSQTQTDHGVTPMDTTPAPSHPLSGTQGSSLPPTHLTQTWASGNTATATTGPSTFQTGTDSGVTPMDTTPAPNHPLSGTQWWTLPPTHLTQTWASGNTATATTGLSTSQTGTDSAVTPMDTTPAPDPLLLGSAPGAHRKRKRKFSLTSPSDSAVPDKGRCSTAQTPTHRMTSRHSTPTRKRPPPGPPPATCGTSLPSAHLTLTHPRGSTATPRARPSASQTRTGSGVTPVDTASTPNPLLLGAAPGTCRSSLPSKRQHASVAPSGLAATATPSASQTAPNSGMSPRHRTPTPSPLLLGSAPGASWSSLPSKRQHTSVTPSGLAATATPSASHPRPHSGVSHTTMAPSPLLLGSASCARGNSFPSKKQHTVSARRALNLGQGGTRKRRHTSPASRQGAATQPSAPCSVPPSSYSSRPAPPLH